MLPGAAPSRLPGTATLGGQPATLGEQPCHVHIHLQVVVIVLTLIVVVVVQVLVGGIFSGETPSEAVGKVSTRSRCLSLVAPFYFTCFTHCACWLLHLLDFTLLAYLLQAVDGLSRLTGRATQAASSARWLLGGLQQRLASEISEFREAAAMERSLPAPGQSGGGDGGGGDGGAAEAEGEACTARASSEASPAASAAAAPPADMSSFFKEMFKS